MTPPPAAPKPKTTEVARRTGIPVYTLHNYTRAGLIPLPARDSSGHFIWEDADIARAVEAWESRRHLRRDGSAA